MRYKPILLFLILSIILSGCQSRKFEFAQSLENMDKIEILEIDDEQENILAELTSFDIIEDIQNLPYKEYWNDPCQTTIGLALKVYYNDDSYQIVTWECNAYFKDNHSDYGWEYFDKEEYNALLESYLN